MVIIRSAPAADNKTAMRGAYLLSMSQRINLLKVSQEYVKMMRNNEFGQKNSLFREIISS